MNVKVCSGLRRSICRTQSSWVRSIAVRAGEQSLHVTRITHIAKGRTISAGANPQSDDRFRQATTEEEWLQLDEKVNKYPTHRTFKAIGTGGKDFAESMIAAVERATSKSVDRRVQVIQRPSKEGKYTAVSVRGVSIENGKQVLGVFREMKQSGGDRLKYII